MQTRMMVLQTVIEPLRIDDTTPSMEVMCLINATVRRVWPEEEQFSFTYFGRNPETVYAKAKSGMPFWELIGNGRLVAYCVEGASEGHYVHFDMHDGLNETGTGTYRPIMQQKCFAGLERAQQIANLVQFLLGA